MHTKVMEKLVTRNDQDVQFALAQQIKDSSRNHGGILEPSGLASATHVGTGAFIASMASALYSETSRYYRSAEVRSALMDALEFMLRKQHQDGTISLGSTNFHSPPDTAFVVNGMAQVYLLLNEGNWEEGKQLAASVKLFLERAIPAMLTGGGHTPNHRWVLVSALGWLYRIFADQRLQERADQWLAEGLDCTADGEWTERSNGIYNSVTNIMMIYASIWFNRPQLLEPVRRNLNMMLYLVHEDGEVVTDYSGRQDWGSTHNISEYFLCYQWMTEHDQDPLFAAMYDQIVHKITHLGPINNHALLGSLVIPCRHLEDISRASLPDHYRKVLNTDYPMQQYVQQMELVGHHGVIQHSSMHTAFGAPVMRIREGRESATMMTHNPSFFSLRNGEAKLLAMSVTTAFTPGIVVMDQFMETEAGCKLQSTMEKGYYGALTLEQLPPSAGQEISPWYLLPHQLRPQTHVQKHTIKVNVEQRNEEWHLRFESDELEDCMTQIVLLFPGDGSLSGDGLQQADDLAWMWSSGELIYSNGSHRLRFKSGVSNHNVVHMRNAISQGQARKVVINLVTPFVHELIISLEKTTAE